MKTILWLLGLIATFVIDYAIAITTGFTGHAAVLELGYIILSLYIASQRENKDEVNDND